MLNLVKPRYVMPVHGTTNGSSCTPSLQMLSGSTRTTCSAERTGCRSKSTTRGPIREPEQRG